MSLERLCLGCGRRIPRRPGVSYCRSCSSAKKARRNADRPLARAVTASATSCSLCGLGPREGDPFTLEHGTPVSEGGSSSSSNVSAAHRSCNTRKRDR